jgi:hypothetical protein
MTDWVQLFLGSDYGYVLGGPETALFVIPLAFVVGQFIGWSYMSTHHGLSYSQNRGTAKYPATPQPPSSVDQ